MSDNTELYYYLKENEETIYLSAVNGDDLCKNIIAYYTMHCDCPSDPGALTFLEMAVKDHKAKNFKRVGKQ